MRDFSFGGDVIYTVYILIAQDRQRTYVGQTRDVRQRLKWHNAGRVPSTRSHRPWMVLYTEECATRAEAMARERWFKSRQGRSQIAAMISR